MFKNSLRDFPKFENNSRNCMTFSIIYKKHSYKPSKINTFWSNMLGKKTDYFFSSRYRKRYKETIVIWRVD